MSGGIRVVLFDFGGVFTDSPFDAAADFGRKSGIDPARLMETVFGPYHEDTDHPWHRLERGEVSLEAAREEIVALGAEQGFESDPFQVLGALAGAKVRDDMVDLTRDLVGSGYRTAIVTNNVREFRDGWRGMLPVDDLFDLVVDSSEVGLRKPNPRIFEHTLEALGGVDPEQAVFLDDYESNVTAARSTGMHGIHVGKEYADAIRAVDRLLGRG